VCRIIHHLFSELFSNKIFQGVGRREKLLSTSSLKLLPDSFIQAADCVKILLFDNTTIDTRNQWSGRIDNYATFQRSSNFDQIPKSSAISAVGFFSQQQRGCPRKAKMKKRDFSSRRVGISK
jgi:hypothetical protein